MAVKAALKKAPRPADRHIGRRIRMRRRMQRMSQGALGKAVGVTFQQIQKYENGTNRIGGGRLQQIADALGCEPAWFFEGAPSSNGGKTATHPADADFVAFLAGSDAVTVARGFVLLPPRVQSAIADVIAAVAEQATKA
jgi:transcriptional regulator with XRE-family HTH domain